MQLGKEVRTYVLQGIFNIATDRALVKTLIRDLQQLARNDSESKVRLKSLVYAVFIVSAVTDTGSHRYKHYYLCRVQLLEDFVEIYDSYGDLNFTLTEDNPIKQFVRATCPGKFEQFVSTQHFQKGSDCFWGTVKDLICLTAFRSPRMSRTGGEQGFNLQQLRVGPDTNYGRTFVEQITNLCFEIVVNRNKYFLRRLYGKDCTRKET